jgi:phosphatidylglycerol:prolipoprotein diacylglycerol transferase
VDGISIGLDPVLVQVGPAAIRWFGVTIGLGLAAGLWLALRLGKARGIHDGTLFSCALGGIAAGIVGARLVHVVDKLDHYLQNPYYLFSPSQVSMASWGGLLFGAVAVVQVARRRGIPAPTILDVAMPSFLIGQIVGRLGSLVNGESWGSPTGLPWAVTYLHPDSMIPPGRLAMPTHPYAAYELLWVAAVLWLAFALARRLQADGALAAVALLLYSVGRLVLGQFREEGAWLLGLQQAQVIASVVALGCVPWIVYLLAGKGDSPRRVRSDRAPGLPML